MTPTIPAKTGSARLAALWFTSFVIALSIPCVLGIRRTIEWDNLTAGIDQLGGLYAAHLRAVLAFFFATPATRSQSSRVSRTSFLLAIGVSLAWNLMVILLVSQAAFGRADIEEALKMAKESGTKLSWLVAPVMGYYFAKSASPTHT